MITALLILFILIPLLPLIPSPHWSMRFFDFVRIQTLVLQFSVLVAALVFWNIETAWQWGLLIVLVATMLYQVYLIMPYTPFYHRRKPEGPFADERLTLITANVLQTNTNYDTFTDIVKKNNPDILITMESHEPWDQHVTKAFPELKHRLKATHDNFYGMHLYSRLPFDKAKVRYMVEEDIPSMHCELQFANQTFNLIAVHPAPPSPTENETSKERDAELMLIGKECREQQDATVVCGDLNDVVWSKISRLFKKMTGYLDPRVGRGLYPSFHAKYWLLRFPLDHLFYSKDMHVPVMRRLEPFGSDHFAMYYELAFPLIDKKVSNPTLTKEEENEIEGIIEEV